MRSFSQKKVHQYICRRFVSLNNYFNEQTLNVHVYLSCSLKKKTTMFELSISILQVEAIINEESESAKHYLDPTTEEPILKVKINILCLGRMEYNFCLS